MGESAGWVFDESRRLEEGGCQWLEEKRVCAAYIAVGWKVNVSDGRKGKGEDSVVVGPEPDASRLRVVRMRRCKASLPHSEGVGLGTGGCSCPLSAGLESVCAWDVRASRKQPSLSTRGATCSFGLPNSRHHGQQEAAAGIAMILPPGSDIAN